MLKPFSATSDPSEKKPVKKLFDRPVNEQNSATRKTRAKTRAPGSEKLSELDGLISEQKSLSVYGLAMLVIILLILWTGVLTVEQVQDYHHQYTELQKLKREQRKLEIEHQRLLIEQQTFSATPQIAKRAVAELNMYYPQLSDRMILQSNPPANSVPVTEIVPDDVNTKVSTKTSVAVPKPAPIKNNDTQAVTNAPVVKSEAAQ